MRSFRQKPEPSVFLPSFRRKRDSIVSPCDPALACAWWQKARSGVPCVPGDSSQATRGCCAVAHPRRLFKQANPYRRGERTVFTRFAICLAILALAGCGTRSFVMPTRDGALLVTGSSAHLSGAQEKERLVGDADEYCKRRGKSAVVIASRENDAKPGTLAAPGKLARATVEFGCQ